MADSETPELPTPPADGTEAEGDNRSSVGPASCRSTTGWKPVPHNTPHYNTPDRDALHYDSDRNQAGDSRSLVAGPTLAVLVLVIIAHWPALHAGALSFDDNQYLTDNPLVQTPGFTSAWRFLTEVLEPSTVRGYYQPLTMISLMVDYALGGRPENLLPFHRTSLILHLTNTFLVIVLLYLLFRRAWPAAIAGLIFGVHPQTIETIAWVGERKTVLAGCFALLSLLAYVRGVQRGSRWHLAASWLAFLFALMSKPTSTPLPILLLLLDYWPLKRRLSWRLIAEKVPFLALAAVFAIITVISQGRTALVALPSEHPLLRLPLMLCYEIVFYLYKMAWPVTLTSHYPVPTPFTLGHPRVLEALIGTAILLGALLASLRWTRALLAGWLFFMLALLPTTGVIGFTNILVSDKFAYLPATGLLMTLTWLLGRLWAHPPGVAVPTLRQSLTLAACLLFAGFEGINTRLYLLEWRTTDTLFEHMLKIAPRSSSLNNNLGVFWVEEEEREQAIHHFKRALELQSDNFSAHSNLGRVLLQVGREEEAPAHFRKAIEIRPEFAGAAWFSLGEMAERKGKRDEAIECYRNALSHRPLALEACLRLARLATEAERFDEAADAYRRAIALRPRQPELHNNLGSILARQQNYAEAIVHFRQAVALRPDLTDARFNLALALIREGSTQEAIDQLKAILERDPNHARARDLLRQITTMTRPAGSVD